MRGLHLNDDTTESGNHSSPSPEPHIRTSPSPDAIQLADSPRKRKKKFDHTEVIEVSVGSDFTLLPSNECFNKCTYYFWQMNDEEGVNWKKVTKRTKDFYWGEFKKYITHPGKKKRCTRLGTRRQPADMQIGLVSCPN